jgi:hypothetical protein
MDTNEFIKQVMANLNWFDLAAIFITYYFTQAFKGIVEKDEYKRLVAIVVGMGVALALSSLTGGWKQVPFFGMLYGAASMFLYQTKILEKVGEVIKGKIK